MTRILLVSGKGGVGKTTVAAATGVGAARAGHRVVVASVDRAHNLGDVLGTELGPDPLPVPGARGLFAFEADPQHELERRWRTLSAYFARLLEWAGVPSAEADEVAIFPGLEELLVLTRLQEIVERGEHDLVIVDLAPTASSLRLLSFPEMMAGPFGRLVKWERSILKLLRPAARRVMSVPVPDDEIYETLLQLAESLGRLRTLLTDPKRTVVRLVSIPERVVVDETCSAHTLLSLFGMCVDGVVLNRVLPPEAASGYLAQWAGIQAREAKRARERLAGAPIFELRFQQTEVLGVQALAAAAAEIYGKRDPASAFATRSPLRIRARNKKETILELDLPGAEEGKLDLKQRGGELVVTLGGWRRQLPLPPSLAARSVQSASFADGTLSVCFGPIQPMEEQS
jgi:arsenite-transporting ATPase